MSYAIQMSLPPPVRTAGRADEAQHGARLHQLERFLKSVERRTLVMLELGSGDRDESVDLLQEAMTRFVARYASRPEIEWGPLFYRVANNVLIDHQRRRAVRRRIVSAWQWFSGRGVDHSGALAEPPCERTPGPEHQASSGEFANGLLAALAQLPQRQRQVFLLRVWEGLDVAQTASALGIGSGSVKTHLSRAVKRLREELEDHA